MPKSLIWAIFIIQGVAAIWGTPARSQGFENLDRLDRLVAATVGANVGEPGGPRAPIDRRLRLAACPQTPTIEGPVFGAAIVKCDKLGWRIRVPLSGDAAVAGAPAAGRAGSRTVIIKKGDPVQLVAGNANFSVSRTMVAEEDGAPGDMIRVRQDRTSPTVSGRVEPDGIIRIPGI
ncbi:MAG: flagella basal body P-ring formation protein FlgA [Sphingobium sp.]